MKSGRNSGLHPNHKPDEGALGEPRIHSEPLKLGINVSQATVAKYIVRHRKPPSQTWRTFLPNHVAQLASVNFFTVGTMVRDTVCIRRARTRSSPSPALQCDGTSDSRVDCPTNLGSLSVRHGAAISLARSRWNLWIRIPQASRSDGNWRSPWHV